MPAGVSIRAEENIVLILFLPFQDHVQIATFEIGLKLDLVGQFRVYSDKMLLRTLIISLKLTVLDFADQFIS